MELKEAVRKRRSIRKYVKGAPLPEEDLRGILEAAMMAPSARNGRPWEFVVVESEEKKKEVVDAHPYCRHLLEAAAGIVVLVPGPFEETGYRFTPQDAGAAIENLMLEALDRGFGTCWCGIFPGKERVEKIAEILGTDMIPIGIVTVGKAAEEPAARGYYDEKKVRRI